MSTFLLLSISGTRSKVNNGCHSGLKRARGGENGVLGGIKHQGERLALIRYFHWDRKKFFSLQLLQDWAATCGLVHVLQHGQKVNLSWFIEASNGFCGLHMLSTGSLNHRLSFLPFAILSFCVCVFDLTYSPTGTEKLQEGTNFPGNIRFRIHYLFM